MPMPPACHEWLAVHLEHVDGPGAPADDAVQRAGDIGRDAVRLREIVASAERQHAKGDAGARELLRHEPNGAIAAGRHHHGRALLGGDPAREPSPLPLGAAGRHDLDPVAASERTFGGLAPLAASHATRVRVGDDESRCRCADGRWSKGHRGYLRRTTAPVRKVGSSTGR
jgi:hypothetical protein